MGNDNTAAAPTAEETKNEVALTEPTTGGPISVYASEANFKTAQRMAIQLSQSSLVPTAYRAQSGIGNCLIAMELAGRTGMPTLMVMQNLHVVKGKPSWASTFLTACVNSCGRFSPLRYRFQGEEGSDDWGCRAVAIENETGEELVGTLITIGLAKAEGWWSRKDRDGNETSKWQTMPEQMLRYRAAAFWARAYAPELSLGMHTADEIRDLGDASAPSPGAQALNEALGIGTVDAEDANVDDENAGDAGDAGVEVTDKHVDGTPPADDDEAEAPEAPADDPEMEEQTQLSKAALVQFKKELGAVKTLAGFTAWEKKTAKSQEKMIVDHQAELEDLKAAKREELESEATE